jgi:hypothetical protein
VTILEVSLCDVVLKIAGTPIPPLRGLDVAATAAQAVEA